MSLDGSRAEFYRHRAATVRAVAENCLDAAIKDQLERVAKEYEALALMVDRELISH